MNRKYYWLLCLLPTMTMAANQNDLEKLIALKKSQTTPLDLSNADLRNYPFIQGKIDLKQANISHSNLAGVNLSTMDLKGADLSYTDLSQAKLNGANLTDANLTCANLNQADLTNSNFANTTISGATFVNTITTDIIGYDSVIDNKTNCAG